MRVELFLADKIIEFKLPQIVSGSYNFDENENETSKLINIEAIKDKWFLCGNNEVSIVVNDSEVLQQEIMPKQFYKLRRNNQDYLVYIDELFDDTLTAYGFNNKINILFGNGTNCNVFYNIKQNKGDIFKINYQNGGLLLTAINDKAIYVNNSRITSDKIVLRFGDRIRYYGISFIVLNGVILINNPENLISVNNVTSNISKINFNISSELSKEEVKNTDLYSENDYFSKSPRLKRFIETREIKLDPPPSKEKEDDTPLLIVIGPMLTMAVTSMTTLVSTLNRITTGETTMNKSWPQLVSGIAMLAGSLLWPLITKFYQKNQKKKKRKELEKKYTKYLDKNEKILQSETTLQKAILIENLVPLEECIKNIQQRGTLFWNKRNDENDFLVVRVGTGNAKLNVDIKEPEEGFTIDEDELKTKMENLIEQYRYIENVPMSFSIYENPTTAIMGNVNKCAAFTNNIILQLITFYSYEDIKLVVITNKKNEHKWDYIRYLNHNFSNDKTVRLFGSDDESIKNVSSYLDYVVKSREGSEEDFNGKPYYIIITDNYQSIKKSEFAKIVTESDKNLGFSFLILENRLSKLPSKCNTFISLATSDGNILKNSADSQEITVFKDEVNYNINMMQLARILSNIPIEFEEGVSGLPDTVQFLEMEKVGKVEQLNILNRWKVNNPTESLKAEVGYDETGGLIYLDLHEKYHGPHGLIAGTTGSGKSEFIITYILSMCVNYSPDYISFILIDYKGGGLAGAFENQKTGVYLPHLAGTITNLDKAEMDRTLVSIDSEVKRRQKMFNEARDALGESTIDIYKYQRFYRDGRLKDPIPHLFIICDEFAELKAQQPDFMDNLISVARIGRSLGVHLILATQKPSGVVNDQIWSNTKFRVCLKVANEADSKEMLKRPEAAFIKQTGRFYLQVGTDELFELGQSAWCGAKYFPSNQIVEQIDKSINFIDPSGRVIKSIAESVKKGEAQGEQLAAVLKEIISVARKTKLKADRLWLENIPEIILTDALMEKYNIKPTPYDIKAVLGEYDAPELQEQGLLEYDYLNEGNTIIYGLDSGEREMLLNTMIYSTALLHSPEEINYYMLDYGSESLRMFSKFPHVGGMVFIGEDEKYKNLFKLIKEELKTRKKILSSYGGEFKNYNKSSNNKLPLKVFIFNNFDSIFENDNSLYDELPDLIRDSERYGIIFIFTANTISSVNSKISQNFNNVYSFRLKDMSDYMAAFNSRKKIEPRDTFGRGLVNNGDVHEFQTCSIVEDENTLNEVMLNLGEELSKKYQKAERIPELPDQISYDVIKNYISDITNIPVGISKSELMPIRYDLTVSPGTIITANKLASTNKFLISFLAVLSKIINTNTIFIDGNSKFSAAKEVVSNYYNDNFDLVLEKIIEYLENLNNTNINQIIIIYGLDKFISKLENTSNMSKLTDIIKKNDKFRFILLDDATKLKQYAFEQWFSKNVSLSDGLWIGKGIGDQTLFKTGVFKKEFNANISNSYGYYISEATTEHIKLIDFTKKQQGDNDEK